MTADTLSPMASSIGSSTGPSMFSLPEMRVGTLSLQSPSSSTSTENGSAPSNRLLDYARHTYPRYQFTPLHTLIAEALEAVERGELDRVIIMTPPRHGKSELVSVRFPAWYLGRHPDRRIIGTSYSAHLATRFSGQARNQLDDPRWPFPGIELTGDTRSKSSWDIAGHTGGYVAAGVGGPITGSGAHLAIIDDPIKNAEEADSATYRQKVWDWYQTTLYTRLEDRGAIVLVLTRWHMDDLAGRLLAAQDAGGDRWHVVKLPAIAEEHDQMGRAEGEALWPEKYGVAELERIKRAVGSRTWAALYQQRPAPAEGGILKRHWWRFYEQAPDYADEVIQSWDLAFKDTKSSAYVVGQVWARNGADFYLIDQVRDKLSFTETVRAIETLSAKWPMAAAKLVEDKANGPAVLDSLSARVPGLIPIQPHGSKEARAHAVSPFIEAGNVWLPTPQNAPWVSDFVEECAAFPAGTYADQVDAMTQALDRLALSAHEELVEYDDAVTISRY